MPEHMAGFYDDGSGSYGCYEQYGGDEPFEPFREETGAVSERQEARKCFVMTISRMHEGTVAMKRTMLFSDYDKASAWLTGNGFFCEESPWRTEQMEAGRRWEWVHEGSGPEDLLTASVEAVNMDDGNPIPVTETC